MVREIVRLSTYLRTFGNVCHPDDKLIDDEEENIIEKKRDAEIIRRRLLEKRRKAEENENLEPVEEKPLFGANIPFTIEFKEPTIPPEELAKFTRPNPAAKFHLKNQINFEYQHDQGSSTR